MPIIKLSVQLFVSSLVIYAAVYALFSGIRHYTVYHDRLEVIDNYHAKSDPCIEHDAQSAVLFKNRITRQNNPPLIILGGSSVRDGFRPEEVHNFFQGFHVHNLAFSSANVTQMSEVVRFLRDTSPPGQYKGGLFVFGLFSGSLISNEGRNWHINQGPFPSQVSYLKAYQRLETGEYRPVLDNTLSELYLAGSMPMVCLASNMRLLKQDHRKFLQAIFNPKEPEQTASAEKKKQYSGRHGP